MTTEKKNEMEERMERSFVLAETLSPLSPAFEPLGQAQCQERFAQI